MTDWEAELRRLPDPVAPTTSVAAIMTRVRAADGGNDLQIANDGIRDHKIAPTVDAEASGADWRPWAAAAGVAAVVAAYVPGVLGGQLAERLLSLRLAAWPDGSLTTPAPVPLALLTAAGLAVYLLGAAAPLRQRHPADGRK